jgi:hypothetical protein
MSIEQARLAKFKEIVRSIQEGGGWCVESDEYMNEAQRRLIDAMAEHYGTVYLGSVNLYGEDRHKPIVLRKYPDGEIVYNFSASFVVPTDDEVLKRLIYERDNAEYTGTTEDAVRVEAIHDRIKEIGGYTLIWS